MDIAAFFELVNHYSGLITAASIITGGLWAVFKFRENIRDKRFVTYHDLIDQLVNEQRNPDRAIKIDRQVAIIFELRNFTDYYPVTKRILSALKIHWAHEARVVFEINHTLNFLNKNMFEKFWIRSFKTN